MANPSGSNGEMEVTSGNLQFEEVFPSFCLALRRNSGDVVLSVILRSKTAMVRSAAFEYRAAEELSVVLLFSLRKHAMELVAFFFASDEINKPD